MAREYRERLIEEVRRRPTLWDTTSDDHKDMDARDACWQDISTVLGTNSEVLKREWKTLRDSLRQSLRSRAPHGKRWRYQAKMAFLFPYMTKRTQRQVPRLRIKPENSGESGAGWGAGDAGDAAHNGADTTVSASAVGDGDGGGGGGGAGEALELFFASVCRAAGALPAGGRRRLQRAVLAALHREEDAAERAHDSHDCHDAGDTAHAPADDY